METRWRNLLSAKALIAIVFFAVTGCVAQVGASSGTAGPSLNQTRSHRESIPGGVRTLRGCLSKSDAGEFFLVPQRGPKVQLKSAEDLAPHVGQQVKASGSFIDPPGSVPHSSNSPPIKSAKDVHHDHEFHVLKIEVVSQSCPAAKKK